MKVNHNIARLQHLLHVHGMSVEELCVHISGKRPVEPTDILNTDIKLAYLKRIDKVFEQGLSYYLNPAPPSVDKSSSVFYRKKEFNGVLNLRDHQLVNNFEGKMHLISAYSKLADIALERKLPVYGLRNNPADVGAEVCRELGPIYSRDLKTHLKKFIKALAAQNVMVFEFIEHAGRKVKGNVDGFFIQPNAIVLKRQKYLRRELFTLAHELGHYLLNQEEIESVEDYLEASANKVEQWCNEFAFHLLGGQEVKLLDEIERASPANDYHHELIQQISDKTNLSRFALFTRLLFLNKISRKYYSLVKRDLQGQIDREERRKREEAENDNIMMRSPKAITSPLLTEVMKLAYYNGVVEAHEVGQMLNAKPDKVKTLLE